MTQVTVTKAAAKTTKRAAKPAAKPAAAAPVVTLAYGLKNGYRPGAGRLLFAFTHAWLNASGLTAGGTLQRETAEKVAGGTAVKYHLGNGNLSDTKGALSLTAAGKAFFAARGVDAKAAEAFAEALRTGKPNPEIGLKVEAAFVKLG